MATEAMTLSTMTTTMTMKMRMRILTPRPKSPTRYHRHAESFTKLQSKAIFRLNFLKVIIISGVYFEINYWL